MPAHFDDELGNALHATAETFHPEDPQRLVAAGHRTGRKLRRRRTAVVAAGAATLAAVAAGGVLAGTAGSPAHRAGPAAAPAPATTTAQTPAPAQTTTAPAPATTPPPHTAPVTGKQISTVLSTLLPKGTRTTKVDYTGQGPDYATAAIVVNDGHGLASVSAIIESQGTLPSCPTAGSGGPGTSCKLTHVGGGTLFVYKGFEYPDHKGNVKEWLAQFVTPDGHSVTVSEYNAPSEKDTPITRTNPPLDTAQLTAVARAAAWKPLLAALEQPKPYAK
ncbi:hypothetical protein [Actinacidiphila epipremni]|uniref:Uncharacterized protein n=1 Tax=Actinacidiphila epipremni TaxID=2053013 RepID=A0ABX0ZHV2_9ACTN|nr:hypothetical protein [Actinacidiphila epipremni]NJP43414.1 hypothetical protein [Actinacidiphila epipremni]